MNTKQISRIFTDTAYVRMGGSPEEAQAAHYIHQLAEAIAPGATIETFPVDMAKILEARLLVDGKQIPCKGYLCAGNAQLEAPLYYLRDTSPYSLSQCKGKIVLLDGYLGYWKYRDILDNGALGFIT